MDPTTSSAAWEIIKVGGVSALLFVAVTMFVSGVLMPKANHEAMMKSQAEVIAEKQRTIEALRNDRDEWRGTATVLTSQIPALITAVERMREVVAQCVVTRRP